MCYLKKKKKKKKKILLFSSTPEVMQNENMFEDFIEKLRT